MRVFNIGSNGVRETSSLDNVSAHERLGHDYIWITCTQDEFAEKKNEAQATLQSVCGMQLVDLHISDLLNTYIPSHYDHTSQYDIIVLRQLAADHGGKDRARDRDPSEPSAHKGGPPILKRTDTSPVGFAVFDQILLTVHPTDRMVREAYAARLQAASSDESRANGVRVHTSPADLMLRIEHSSGTRATDCRIESKTENTSTPRQIAPVTDMKKPGKDGTNRWYE